MQRGTEATASHEHGAALSVVVALRGGSLGTGPLSSCWSLMAQASQWTHLASLDSSAVANSYPMDETPLKGQVLGIQPHSGGRSRPLGTGLSPVEVLAKGKWQGG